MIWYDFYINWHVYFYINSNSVQEFKQYQTNAQPAPPVTPYFAVLLLTQQTATRKKQGGQKANWESHISNLKSLKKKIK